MNFFNATSGMSEWKGESADVVISFDEGAEFKEPGTSSYDLRVVTANHDFESQGSSLLVQAFANTNAVLTGELHFTWSSQIDFSASFDQTVGAYSFSFKCSGVPGLKVGNDQYVVPASFACPDGTMQLYKHGIPNEWANATGAFSYH